LKAGGPMACAPCGGWSGCSRRRSWGWALWSGGSARRCCWSAACSCATRWFAGRCGWSRSSAAGGCSRARGRCCEARPSGSAPGRPAASPETGTVTGRGRTAARGRGSARAGSRAGSAGERSERSGAEPGWGSSAAPGASAQAVTRVALDERGAGPAAPAQAARRRGGRSDATGCASAGRTATRRPAGRAARTGGGVGSS